MSQVATAGGLASDGGSIPRGRTAARAGPAPVLTEASIRRRREHSRQASLDTAAREFGLALGSGNGAGEAALQARRAGYMAQTQSSLRHASLGSEASMTGSVRRLRARGGSGDRDDVSDVASVASSQWSVRRRRVGPRQLKPVERPVSGPGAERAQRIAARSAAARQAAELADTEERLQGNAVVVRGGTRVAASRKDSPDVSGGAAAGSTSATAITVSDDDTGELTKSGVSVSLSPVTSGTRSARRSQQQHARRGSAGAGSSGGGGGPSELTGDDGDYQEDPVPRATQPVVFDSYATGSGSGGPQRHVYPTMLTRTASAGAADKAGRPPLTPRGEASPHTGGGARRNSYDTVEYVPATTLTSNTVHRSASVGTEASVPRRQSVGEAARHGTASHRVATEGRRPSLDYDGGRKSAGDGAVDDTPISVLKERANREAQHNARRDSGQPLVPRLALGDITAKREQRHRRSSRYPHSGGGGYEAHTPVTSGGSVLSDVTVSSMTDSATPHPQGSSGRAVMSNGRATQHSEDVRVDPSPSVSAVQAGKQAGQQQQQQDATATYDSHGASPARVEADDEKPYNTNDTEADANVKTVVSPSRTTTPAGTVTRDRDGRGQEQQQVATAPSPPASTVVNQRSSAAEQRGGGVASGGAQGDGRKREAARSASPQQPAKTNAAASSPKNTAAERGKRQRNFERGSGPTAAAPPGPPVAKPKEGGGKCCVVM